MRSVLEQWQKETKDLGLVPEAELRERMRPGGIWAKVEKPVISETVTAPDSVKLKSRDQTDHTARHSLGGLDQRKVVVTVEVH